jgi:UDP-N-acetylmuramyl pentapeptide phosphotransferase/UDP-N-acetylglucosamine-1-phosphate transferase
MSNYSPLISAAVTLTLAQMLVMSKSVNLQDIPNERSLHAAPIPRTGGIALMVGILSGWMMLREFWVWWVVFPTLGLFVLSLLDDVRNLSPGTRLIGHFIAAALVILGASVDGLWIFPVWLFIVWITNLYNFMDGSDGMAGGMALFGFSCYGVAGLMGGNEAFAMMNLSIGAAALGFLFLNFHPARIFMGDAGSIPLGFLAAAFGVWGWQLGYWPFWFPLITFSPFVADATLTLMKRVRQKENILQAHRGHYYQRLVQMGWGHRKTALSEYMLMLLAACSALWGITMDPITQGCLLAGWTVLYLGLAMWIDRCWKRHEDTRGKRAED